MCPHLTNSQLVFMSLQNSINLHMNLHFSNGKVIVFTCSASAGQCLITVVVVVVVVVVGKKFKIEA